MMPSRRESILVLPLLSLLVVLPFWQLVTGRGVVITNDVGVSDIAHLQYPLRFFAGQQLRQGRLPLWTPGVYMGYPFLAEGQAGVFSPVNLLLYALLRVPDALNIGSVLPFILAAVGAYLLARALGASAAGAFLAGFGYAMSGFYVAHVKHIPIVTTATWIPVVLWLVERGVRRSDRALLVAGLVLGVQWLSGSPQMAYYSTGMAGLYFLGRSWQTRQERSLRRSVPTFALSLLLAGGLAAVQLLPTLELTGFSERAGGVSYEFAVRFPYAVENLKTFLYPLANGTPGTGDLTVSTIFWEDYAYVGLITLLMGIVGGLILARRPGVARLLVGLLVATFLLVLGPHTPVFGWAYRVVPGLGFFRFPQRLLAFVVLFIALLAALTLTHLQQRLQEQPGRRQQRKEHTSPPRVRRERLAQLLTLSTLLLVMVDLYTYHVPWNAIVDRDVWLTPPQTAQVVQERAGADLYRVFSYDVYNTFRAAYRQAGGWRGDLTPYIEQREFLQPSLNLIYDVPAADGYINLVPDYLAVVWGTEKALGVMDTGLVASGEQLFPKPGYAKLLGLFNVRFLITSQPVQDDALALVSIYGPGAHLYENHLTLPRAYAVPAFTVEEDPRAALELMRSTRFDPQTTVILQETPDVLTLDPPIAEEVEWNASVEVLTYEPTRVVVRATLDDPGWLVLSDTYYPGWEAAVDDQPVSIYQANVSVRAVPLAAGSHTVTFQFRPRPLHTGAWISGISAMIWLAAFGVVKHRQSL